MKREAPAAYMPVTLRHYCRGLCGGGGMSDITYGGTSAALVWFDLGPYSYIHLDSLLVVIASLACYRRLVLYFCILGTGIGLWV